MNMLKKGIITLVDKKKRKGRGIAAGCGKTCGRGTKGQKARKSGRVRIGFEGGQTPIYRRIPKVGFYHEKQEFEIINISKFENDNLSNDSFNFSNNRKKVKILASGVLTKKIFVKAHKFSASAKKKIIDNGGQALEI
jgi:large subunit ribosomal protein L15